MRGSENDLGRGKSGAGVWLEFSLVSKVMEERRDSAMNRHQALKDKR